ncbi:MAG: RIP metalloprotease RseP, partial [Duncaniella sp.]|nr:RIP metalloprotease RseP [Duncaniella sp.]
MEAFLIKAAQLIVALAFLVIIHEFGHYIFARIFGIKVEKFYMFFDPYFSLVKWKPKPKKNADPNKTSWRDTEYGIGWIPLGGYCKIAGMIDESMDTEQMKQEPKPWEFRTKPAYQRLLVMLGGVLFNFILAILIYAGIAMHWGSQYIPFEAATEGFDFVPAAQAVGFRNGDIPLMADGEKLDASKGDYPYQMAEAKTVTVLRNKKDTVQISIPENFIFRLNEDKGFLGYRLPVYIDRIVAGEAAAKAGLKEGDHIVAVDTISTPTYTELTPALTAFAGKETTVTVERDGKRLTMPITPNEFGKLGFQLRPLTAIYKPVTIDYGFFQSFPKGWEIGTTTLGNYVSSMKHVFSSEGAQSLGGFGAIGSMFPEKGNWLSFWEITAFLSVALAFMNIIPIP